MYRKKLLRGVSAGAISLVCLAVWPQAASAQQAPHAGDADTGSPAWAGGAEGVARRGWRTR